MNLVYAQEICFLEIISIIFKVIDTGIIILLTFPIRKCYDQVFCGGPETVIVFHRLRYIGIIKRQKPYTKVKILIAVLYSYGQHTIGLNIRQICSCRKRHGITAKIVKTYPRIRIIRPVQDELHINNIIDMIAIDSIKYQIVFIVAEKIIFNVSAAGYKLSGAYVIHTHIGCISIDHGASSARREFVFALYR